MAVSDYKKFKISLNPDSNKLQGLRTGDIVRRQYYDGSDIIYTLMCVLDYGESNIIVEEPVLDENGEPLIDENNEIVKEEITRVQPWFIGALLDGDEPKPGEILDFVRITSLFNTDRSGALYLTASDTDSPFMDVIDGIGKDCSLCWPESIADYQTISDPQTQYCIYGDPQSKEYLKYEGDRNRVCHLVKGSGTLWLKQNFYEYINEFKTVNQLSSKNQIIVSYWSKSNKSGKISVTVGYEDNSRIDGVTQQNVETEWTYNVHVITIENSGRHLRSMTMDFSSLSQGQDIYIADLNVILLSSLANYGDASQIRVGRLSGIIDPVFGKLEGYGSYLQKLYASSSAHISGTLTAGDENGFAATFYAGKIHKNAFVNSLEIEELNKLYPYDISKDGIFNPTGIGNVYKSSKPIKLRAQSGDWIFGNLDKKNKIGQRYCFSFWVYTTTACKLFISQDSQIIGTTYIDVEESLGWQRQHVVFEIQEPENFDLIFTVTPSFEDIEGINGTHIFYFTAPQLEEGNRVTQYQPTDGVLNYCEDYGAWFSRGGIGGTIQNPLLRLNADGNGAIASRSDSFRLNQDGSGHLANGNIKWDKDGDVEFGEDVKVNWGNFSDDAKDHIKSKSVSIEGIDMFSITNYEGSQSIYFPVSITLTANETNIDSEVKDRHWFVLRSGKYEEISDNNFISSDRLQITIDPENKLVWDDDLLYTNLKYSVICDGVEYSDTFTIKKINVEGYKVIITSVNGELMKNGICSTILTAHVYYNGHLIPDEEAKARFDFLWHKYKLPDQEYEISRWWEQDNIVNNAVIDRTNNIIILNYNLTGSDFFVCEIKNKSHSFPCGFPILFKSDKFTQFPHIFKS